MSIATEIQRLQTDSTAIANAIVAKGVTVPSGSGYDDYASLISAIPTGGGGGGDPELPSGYTRKDYIYGDGGAYILTELEGNITWIITVQADASQTGKHFVGCSGTAGCYFGINSNGNLGFSTSSNQYTTTPTSSTKINCAVLFGSNFTAASINQRVVYRSGSVTKSGYFKLFRATSTTQVAAKLWVADAWQGTSLVFHGVPCLNPSNVAGLYDTVSNTFYPSSGDNAFTAGNDS